MKQKHFIILENGTDWNDISFGAAIHNPNMTFIKNGYVCACSKLLAPFIKFSFSYKANRFFEIPLKRFFLPRIIEGLQLKKEAQNILVIFDRNPLSNDDTFLRTVKNLKSTSVAIVYVFTNIAKFSGAKEHNCIDKLNDWYDVVFAFDPKDAERYEFAYSPLIYDADPDYRKEEMESKEPLVFYVGQAKDRLTGLLSCYEKLKTLGIKCDFHIANVKEADIKHENEIIYNKFMTYKECVESIQKSTCLIDVIQGDSSGLTIKTCEAVCYDKKLITTNKHVVEYPFYDPRYIRVVESPDDIDIQFFTENTDVHYSEEGKKYFSAATFFQRLENELNKV